MAADVLGQRAQRFLNGPLVSDDLTKLFVELRFTSWGMATIEELGNFVAHRNDRDIGLVTVVAKDFFTHVRFLARGPLVGKNIDISKPVDRKTLAFFDASYRSADKQEINKRTGLKVRKLDATYRKLRQEFKEHSSGEFLLAPGLPADMLALLKYVATILTVRPAFDAERLIKETRLVFIKNKLMTESDSGKFADKSQLLALYALAVMHGATVSLGVGDSAYLSLVIDEKGALGIDAFASVDFSDKKVDVVMRMFETSLRAIDSCDDSLLKAAVAGKLQDIGIELTPSGKLGLI